MPVVVTFRDNKTRHVNEANSNVTVRVLYKKGKKEEENVVRYQLGRSQPKKIAFYNICSIGRGIYMHE